MMIRNATLDDLEAIAELELACFPAAEAATKEDFKKRLKSYPNHFWLLFSEGMLIALIDGFCTDEADLADEMYENAALHDEDGDWQMIFGLLTHPDWRNQGHASRLVRHMIQDARNQNRSGVVLTCKSHLVDYYSRFGFEDEGTSQSNHGGQVWNQMRLRF